MAKKNSSTPSRDINLLQMNDILRQMSNENTARTFEFNASEAEKARQFQADMSNTSHQREVEDLKRAGINPVLSANGGAQSYSASSASGSADNSAVGVLASIYQTKMNNDNAVKIARMQNANNLEMAKINAAASNYAANSSAGASKYATDRSKYGFIDSFISGFNGKDKFNSASKVGKFFGSNMSKANSHGLWEYGFGSKAGSKVGKAIKKFFN